MKTYSINSSRLVFSLALAAALGCGGLASGETYLPVPIPVPSGAMSISANGLNNLGVVVGSTQIKSGRDVVGGPALVSANGTSTMLPLLVANVNALAWEISDTGLIVGMTNTTPRRATWWQQTSNGTWTVGDWNSQLPTGSLPVLRTAKAISSDGQYIAFEAEDPATGRLHAVLAKIQPEGLAFWTISNVGDPPVPVYSSSVNDVQSDAGVVRMTGQISHVGGFSWELNEATGAVTLRSLAPAVPGGTVICKSINSAGVVAGFGFTDASASSLRGMLWGTDGSAFLMPTLGGSTTASAINNSSSVVGVSSALVRKNTYSERAFLWQPATGIRDLNALKSPADTSGIELRSASRINDAGQILANGTTKAGSSWVLLQPQP